MRRALSVVALVPVLLAPQLRAAEAQSKAAKIEATRAARVAVTLEAEPTCPASAAPIVGAWTSTGRQTNADDLQWNTQQAGDPSVFDWTPGGPEIVLTQPGTYIIQTRIPVYGTPRNEQHVTPAAVVTVTGVLDVYQRAIAGRNGFSYLTHLLVYEKPDTTPQGVVIGFGADELGWTEGAVLVIEKAGN